MDVLVKEQAKEMMLSIADAVIEAKPMLTEVDSKIGDGDHGIGMEGGLKKAKEKLENLELINSVYQPFEMAGKAMLMSMGGASGVIFGSMFLAGAKGRENKEELTAAEFVEMMETSLKAIQERGKAQVGDKTMVDAFSPAVDAMKEFAAQGFLVMFKKAEEAAKKGVEFTKTIEARFGRAKTQGTTIGFQDAGATSVWIIIKTMKEYAEKN